MGEESFLFLLFSLRNAMSRHRGIIAIIVGEILVVSVIDNLTCYELEGVIV